MAQEDLFPKTIYKTRTALIKLMEKDVVHYDIYQDAEVVLEDAEEYIRIQSILGKGKPVKNLTDIRKVKSISVAARDRLKELDINSIHKASALIVNSPVSKVIGNFFMLINRPSYPTKLFTDKENALNWLKAME